MQEAYLLSFRGVGAVLWTLLLESYQRLNNSAGRPPAPHQNVDACFVLTLLLESYQCLNSSAEGHQRLIRMSMHVLFCLP